MNVDFVTRHDVGAGNAGRCVIGHVDALRRVGPLIAEHGAAHPEDAPVAIGGNFHRPVLLAFLDGGREMFAPVLDPFHRRVQQLCRQRDGNFFAIGDILGAEPTADIRRDDTNAALVDSEQSHDGGTNFMRHLGRRP